MSSYGFLSVVPVLTVILIAVMTKRTLVALFTGTLVGVLIVNPAEFFSTWTGYFGAVMSDATVQWLFLVVALFGILIAVFEKSGAVMEFTQWAERYVNSRKKALLMTYVLGAIIFLDDYLHNLAVGSTMKTITDKYQIPRTQLGYIVNSLAAPLCVLVPISTWAVYFGGLLETQGVKVHGSGIGAFIQCIPFVFYGWFAILLTLLVVLGVFPAIGPIKKHIKVAHETGQLFPENEIYSTKNSAAKEIFISQQRAVESQTAENDVASKKLRPYNFLIPLVTMIVVTVITGIDVEKGTAAGLAAAFLLYAAQRIMGPKEFANAAYEGINNMFFVFVLTALAFTIQHINKDLHLANYIITVTKPFMVGSMLPAVVFVVCSIYAYSTGSFWDMSAIILPIVVPLAQAVHVSPILVGAAVFSAAAFGSNTCLYGDGVILASSATEVQPADLMISTMPYALIAAGASFVCYLIAGFVM